MAAGRRAPRKDGSTAQSPFEFVLIGNPDIAKTRAYKHQVRSHVTRTQHRHARTTISTEARTPRQRSSKRSIRSQSSSVKEERTESPAPPPWDEEPVTTPTLFSNTEAAFSQGAVAYQVFSLHDTDNTIGSSIHALSFDISSLMSHYARVCQIQAGEIDVQFDRKALQTPRWQLYYAFVHQDPILLSAAVLLATRMRLRHIDDAPLTGQALISILNMEQHLVQSINTALSEPGRGTGDHMLVALSLCAAYEVKHGRIQNYHIHMLGLQKIVRMRGGLAQVRKESSYHNLEQLLLWQDANASALAGVQPYLAKLRDVETRQPKADAQIFRI